MDLDGIDGLIHISELSWSHVNHPSEILSIGSTVSVKVLDIDRQRQRISLGLKQTQEDPWQRVMDTYNIGDALEGTVTKVVTFGAFVEILDGVEGLVHISELAQHHVENPREIIQPGDPVRVKILEIDSERRRLSLSIKRVEGQVLPVRPIEPPAEGDDSYDDVPDLGLSEEVFSNEDSAGIDAGAQLDVPVEVQDAVQTAEAGSTAEDAEPPLADGGSPAGDTAPPAAAAGSASAEAPVEAPGEPRHQPPSLASRPAVTLRPVMPARPLGPRQTRHPHSWSGAMTTTAAERPPTRVGSRRRRTRGLNH